MKLTRENFKRLGWMGPCGEWFGFDKTWEHDHFAFGAFPNITNPVDHMEKLGWLRLSCPSDQMLSFPALYCQQSLTQAQQTALFSWCELAGEDYQEILREFNLST
jgi:hypothetical protein